MAKLTTEQWQRYARHVSLSQIGVEGQEKLLASRVLIVGAGGLGSPSALYLAAAGVGTIGLVDFDVVEASNLQRQILHTQQAVGTPKIESARERITSLNPDTNVAAHETRLTSDNAMQIMRDYDVIIDGTDNFQTRYLTNDACVFLRKPNIYGSIYQFEGQATVFRPFEGPCYRCIFPEPPPPGAVPSCAEGGVLGILPGIIGLIQATETIKLLLNLGESLAGRLLLYDALAMEFRTVKLKRNPECPVCGDHPTITALIDYEQFCSGPSPVGAKTKEENMGASISATKLKQKVKGGEKVTIIDVRNPDEYERGHIEGSRLLPLPELKSRIGELEDLKDTEFFVSCQVGGRSAQACGILRAAGFSKPVNVAGGYSEWVRAKD